MLLPNIKNQHTRGDAKALMGMKRWDAQGEACGMPKGEEKGRRREGMRVSLRGMGPLVLIL